MKLQPEAYAVAGKKPETGESHRARSIFPFGVSSSARDADTWSLYLGRSLIAAATLIVCGCQTLPAHAAGEQAVMADKAADMVGVNTHLNYRGSIYDRHYADIVKPRLIELGVRHIRDSPGDPRDTEIKNRYIELGRKGIHTLMINATYADQLYVRSINEQAGSRVIDSVEPPNERDLSGGDWKSKLRQFMIHMYPAYKNDPATKDIKVLGPSFGNTRDAPRQFAAAMPNASNYMDAGNLHDYSGVQPEGKLGGGWGIALRDSLSRYRSLADDKPLQVTENGYIMSGAVFGFPSVPQRAAAKYMPRQFLMHLKNGVTKYYTYELIGWQGDYAILNKDGSRRQQYTAIKNFIRMFSDRGSKFTPGRLDYRLTGNMSDIQHSLFQKRDGRFYLVVWQGVASASGTTDRTMRNLEPAARKLTLELGTKFRQAKLYMPTFSTSSTKTYTSYSGIKSIPLSVPDHILVVELTP